MKSRLVSKYVYKIGMDNKIDREKRRDVIKYKKKRSYFQRSQIMNLAISTILYTISILTVIKGFGIYKRDHDYIYKKQYYLYCLAALFSAVWSFSYAMIWVQTNMEIARKWRAVGMIGVFLLFAFLTEFFIQWLNEAKCIKGYVRIVAILGIFLWPFVIGEESVTFYPHDKIGITYQFSQNIWNTLYNVYAVIVGVNLFIICLCILKQTKRKKLQVIIKRLIKCLIVVMIGMVFDTLLPVLGYDALPGSTLTQGIGVILVAGVLDFKRKSEITIENISQFVYFSVDTPVIIYDNKGEFRIANSGAMEFFGDFRNNIERKKFSELFAVEENCFAFEGNKKAEEAECLLNKRYCHMEISKIFDEYQDITGYIVVLNDLTEKRDIIQKLQISEHEADMANHAKTDFLARMSHEIRTPINGIIGMNEMILQKSEDSQITEYAKLVKVSANNLMNLINDILDISKIEANRIVLENTEYHFRKLLKELAILGNVRAHEKGIDFDMEIKGKIPEKLNGDDNKLRQIAINLIGNAIKYTKIGHVKVIVEGVWEEEKYYVKMIVQDTGIGIKTEHMETIFDAFSRVDSKKNAGIQGTGLGLSIVKNLVEIMEGEICVRSEYGNGSEFEVKIPQVPISEKTFDYIEIKNVEDTDEGAEEIFLKIPEKRILVVDDNDINRFVATELLAYTEAQVDEAESGKACLRLVATNCYDFILLDHIMPEMDGIQTLQELRNMPDNKSKDAKIIVLTANAIQGAKEDYLRHGFDDYLSKPIDMAEVERVLKKYC